MTERVLNVWVPKWNRSGVLCLSERTDTKANCESRMRGLQIQKKAKAVRVEIREIERNKPKVKQ